MGELTTVVNRNNTLESKDSALMAVYSGVARNTRELRSLARVPQEGWDYIDAAVIQIAHEEFNGIADLNSYGLAKNFDGMSAMTYTQRRSSDIGPATMGASPDRRSDAGGLDFDEIGVPLLVTYKDFTINTKELTMAARAGIPYDTYAAEAATVSVTRTLEDTLFNGSVPFSGYTIWGYTQFPDRETFTIADWSNVATKPDTILKNVNSMISKSRQNNHNGGWVLYIPWEYDSKLNEDYTVGPDYPAFSSTRARLLLLDGLLDIKISNALANHNVILAEMKQSSIKLINGLSLQSVLWEAPGSPNWEHTFKVMTLSVPFCISDYNGQTGIVHGTTT